MSETRRQENFRKAHPTPWRVVMPMGHARAQIRAVNDYQVIAGMNLEKAAFIVRAVNSHDALVGALRNFLDNHLFQVAVGGNPNAVERMIADARAILKLASAP